MHARGEIAHSALSAFVNLAPPHSAHTRARRGHQTYYAIPHLLEACSAIQRAVATIQVEGVYGQATAQTLHRLAHMPEE